MPRALHARLQGSASGAADPEKVSASIPACVCQLLCLLRARISQLAGQQWQRSDTSCKRHDGGHDLASIANQLHAAADMPAA